MMKLLIVASVIALAPLVRATELWWTEDCRLPAAAVAGIGASGSSWRLPLVAVTSKKEADSIDGRKIKPSELGAFVQAWRIDDASYSAYSFCLELMRSRELLAELKPEVARKVAPAYSEMSHPLSPGASPEPSGATLVALGMALLGLRRVCMAS